MGWHGFDPYKFDFGEWVIRTNFVQESLEDFVEVLVELEDGLGLRIPFAAVKLTVSITC